MLSYIRLHFDQPMGVGEVSLDGEYRLTPPKWQDSGIGLDAYQTSCRPGDHFEHKKFVPDLTDAFY
ncbi:hypothetical protein [Ottowia thiooxydans]|uniref:hypothetical protein n=1 Tax=Ottowia thiooxydans TaxID=219182 RepID=UPI0012EC01D0|nr:hypothetical protein [Ottowia thiooxydans]